MNFEDAFKHYQAGSATQEEIDYVKTQLKQANEFFEEHPQPAPIKQAELSDVKKARKRLVRAILTPICVVILVLLMVASTLGGVFGKASTYANDSIVYKKDECVQIAINYAYNLAVTSIPDNATNKDYFFNVANYRIDDIDKEFHYNKKDIRLSYYTFVVEVENRYCEYEIEVDTRTGNATLVSVDKK